MSKKSKKFKWGDEKHETQAEIEESIGEFCVGCLDNSDGQLSVVERDGVKYNIQITAKLVPLKSVASAVSGYNGRPIDCASCHREDFDVHHAYVCTSCVMVHVADKMNGPCPQ